MVWWMLLACGGPCAKDGGCLIGEGLSAGLLSVRTGEQADDVWMVGASPDPDDGTGPTALHLQDDAWERLDLSAWPGAELWWVALLADEVVMVGNQGLILEQDRASGAVTKVDGPSEDITFFGVWGASAEDVWAVGQADVGSGPPVLWRRQAGVWAAQSNPVALNGPGAYFKVHGRAADDVWVVGSEGLAMHFDGSTWTRTDTGAGTENTLLLTVDASGENPIAVGGFGNALLLEYVNGAWIDASPAFQPGLNGVCATADQAVAVGQQGSRSDEIEGAWVATEATSRLTQRDWHGCAIDAEGGVWTVGGRIASRPLNQGVVGYQGPARIPDL